jgi:acetyl-CoA C-acetyltransferase
MRAGNKFGAVTLEDSMLHDGLTDPLLKIHMGITAENLADRYAISRDEQDHFALESQRRASAAQAAGLFQAEIVPVPVASRKGTVVVDRDEAIRHDATLDSLAKLKPAFRSGGSVTAGNSSGLNDGAAFVAVTTDTYARSRGLTVKAEILGYATVGVDPAVMGIGPAAAVPAALLRAGIPLAQVDLFELNEAFAVQSLAVMRDLGLPPDKVNLYGGALALGHPIGASGARVLVTLLHALHATGKEIGVASLCIGGGMGIAIVIRAV